MFYLFIIKENNSMGTLVCSAEIIINSQLLK